MNWIGFIESETTIFSLFYHLDSQQIVRWISKSLHFIIKLRIFQIWKLHAWTKSVPNAKFDIELFFDCRFEGNFWADKSLWIFDWLRKKTHQFNEWTFISCVCLSQSKRRGESVLYLLCAEKEREKEQKVIHIHLFRSHSILFPLHTNSPKL